MVPVSTGRNRKQHSFLVFLRLWGIEAPKKSHPACIPFTHTGSPLFHQDASEEQQQEGQGGQELLHFPQHMPHDQQEGRQLCREDGHINQQQPVHLERAEAEAFHYPSHGGVWLEKALFALSVNRPGVNTGCRTAFSGVERRVL